MSPYVISFQDIDRTMHRVVGGKGASLGELSGIEGIRVPDGFCITTEAFERVIGQTSPIGELLDELSLLKVEDRDRIGELSGEIRRVIEGVAIPGKIGQVVTAGVDRLALRADQFAVDLGLVLAERLG